MSASGGFSESSSKNNSLSNASFNQKVWKEQIPFLQQLYGQAGQLFGQSNANMQKALASVPGLVDGLMKGMSPAVQQQLQGGAFANIDANKLQDQIYSSMQQPTATQEINNLIMGGAGNNYADAMKAQYMGDAKRAADNMLSTLDARVAPTGMSGSSRHGIAQSQGLYDINSNLQKNLAETGFNTFDKDLDRKLQIASQADQANFGRQQMLSDMLTGKQGAMAGGFNLGNEMVNTASLPAQLQMLPWQAMQGYASTIGGPQVLSKGKATGQSSGESSAFGMNQSGGCYITTAVTEYFDEPDNGPTLTKLRNFRDTYMQETPERQYQVRMYYELAPGLVEKLNQRPDKDDIYNALNELYIKPAIMAIDKNDLELAHRFYSDMVDRLSVTL